MGEVLQVFSIAGNVVGLGLRLAGVQGSQARTRFRLLPGLIDLQQLLHRVGDQPQRFNLRLVKRDFASAGGADGADWTIPDQDRYGEKSPHAQGQGASRGRHLDADGAAVGTTGQEHRPTH
jgi:hypothetical protein